MSKNKIPWIAAAVIVAALLGCDAQTTEGCLGGPCLDASVWDDAGGGGGGASMCAPPVAMSGDYPCDVFTILHRSCHGCHTDPPQNGAPFSLLRWEDTQAVYDVATGKHVYERMAEVIQPDGFPPMPRQMAGVDAPLLTMDELALVTDWLTAACAEPAPEGQGCECPGTGCN